MSLRRCFNVMLLMTLVLAASAACAPTARLSLQLASFTENYVGVSIRLESEDGNYFLAATFTPPAGHHLYSKDVPMGGLEGLGRPTLLELPAESQMKARGDLTESVPAQEPDFEPRQLLVYPAGSVTLRLPVALPSGNKWVKDEVKVTYMACSAYQCKPPVEGKIVQVNIPGAQMVSNP